MYEIYKAGEFPHWVAGLDVLGTLTGITAAVVPHYNNSEGATHDTRYCYIGENRLRTLENGLPANVGVLGVDEHTALILNLEASTAQVAGAGAVTARWRGTSTVFPSGSTVPIETLRRVVSGEGAAAAAAADADPHTKAGPAAQARSMPAGAAAPDGVSLLAEAERLRSAFDAAVSAGNLTACVAAMLELEQILVDWRADTLQADGSARARRMLRAMVVQLGTARAATRSSREVLAPLVELALDLRAAARRDRNFAAADLVRDRLHRAGIEVRDTPDGVEWEQRGSR